MAPFRFTLRKIPLSERYTSRLAASRQVFLSEARGVGNISRDDKSSLALMPRADAASRKYEWENSVSRFCQVKDRFVEPHIDEASNIFPKHPTGPQLGNNSAHFRPQVAFIRKALPLSCGGEGLVILNFGITRLSALQDPEKDSEIHAALSSLNWPAWLKPGSLRICYLRMYPACYLMTEGGHLRRSLTRWTDWGMAWNGNVLTAKISAFPSQETACTLSDILMSDVEEKYFLSPKQQEVLLFKPTAATKGSASTPPKD